AVLREQAELVFAANVAELVVLGVEARFRGRAGVGVHIRRFARVPGRAQLLEPAQGQPLGPAFLEAPLSPPGLSPARELALVVVAVGAVLHGAAGAGAHARQLAVEGVVAARDGGADAGAAPLHQHRAARVHLVHGGMERGAAAGRGVRLGGVAQAGGEPARIELLLEPSAAGIARFPGPAVAVVLGLFAVGAPVHGAVATAPSP